MTLGERIEQVVEQFEEGHPGQLASKVDISTEELNSIIDYNVAAGIPLINKICEQYPINHRWLMTGEGDKYAKDEEYIPGMTQSDFIQYLTDRHSNEVNELKAAIRGYEEHRRGWLSRNANLIFFIAALCTICSPIILTQFTLFPQIDFSQTGPIGDTIGGITAPVINLFAALLVFLAFREQVKANDLQIRELRTDRSNNKAQESFNIAIGEIDWIYSQYKDFHYFGKYGLAAIDEFSRKKKAWGTSPHAKQQRLIWEQNGRLMYSELFSLKRHLERMIDITRSIDKKQYKALLSSKILIIYRNFTRKYRSKAIDHGSLICSLTNQSHEDLVETLTIHLETLEWLQKTARIKMSSGGYYEDVDRKNRREQKEAERQRSSR